MVDRGTIAVCAVAAIVSTVIVCARTSGLQSSDLPFLALVVVPYLLLGWLAGSVSERSTAARLLFTTTLFLSLGGTALLGLDTPTRYTGPEPGLARSVNMIVGPLLQLMAVSLLGLIFLLRRMMAS